MPGDNGDTRVYAEAYRDARLQIIPVCTDGSQRPALKEWKPYQDPDHQWPLDRFQDRGVGIVRGRASQGLEVIDFDDPSFYAPWCELVESEVPGLIQRLVVVATPRANEAGERGKHVVYRCPSPAGNTSLAYAEKIGEHRPRTAIETRGEGGYVLAPGSPPACHPTSRPYEPLAGDLRELPMLTHEERDALLACARALSKWTIVSDDDKRYANLHGVKIEVARPGDDFAAHANWEDILEPKGWKKVREDGHGRVYWRRPGKKEPGCSATTGCVSDEGREQLHVFSTAASPFEPDGNYNKFTAYALLYHGGDFEAAASELAQQGYGGQGKRKEETNLSSEVVAVGWEPFPTHILPAVLGEFVREAAAATYTDEAAVALPALATIAGAVGNSRRLKLKHRWYEPAVIWCGLVGHSGTRKSPAAELTVSYLEKWEGEQEQWYEQECAAYEVDAARYDAAFKKWKSKGEGEPPQKPEKPRLARIVVSDSTVESLGQQFAANPRGLLLYRDELSGFLGGMDRYKNSGRSDESTYLAMHGARKLQVDRVTREGVRVQNAALSVFGSVCPEVLAAELTPMRFASGLAARFLLAQPPARLVKWSEADLSPSTDEALQQAYDRLLSLQPAQDGPIAMRLSGEGKELWVRYHDELCRGILENDNPRLKAAWSKLLGYCARFALLFALVRWADSLEEESPEEVSADDMRRAIALTRWFTRETDRVYGCLWESHERQSLDELVNLLREHYDGRATIRDLMRGPKRRQWKDAEACETALRALVDADLARWEVCGKRCEIVLVNHEDGRER